MSTILTFTLPTDRGVPAKLLRDMEALLRVQYADHPFMRYGSENARVWEVAIRVEPYEPDEFDEP